VALRYYETGIKLIREHIEMEKEERVAQGGDPDSIVAEEILWPELSNNIGVIYLEVEQYDKAYSSITEAIKQSMNLLKLKPDSPKYKALLITSRFNLAYYYET
jgi:hypothetical protein